MPSKSPLAAPACIPDELQTFLCNTKRRGMELVCVSFGSMPALGFIDFGPLHMRIPGGREEGGGVEGKGGERGGGLFLLLLMRVLKEEGLGGVWILKDWPVYLVSALREQARCVGNSCR